MPDDEGLADPRAPWEEDVDDPTAPRRLLAVMFTDIVGSTELATALGDRRWRELLELQETAVRAEIARFNGVEVDTAGDAFFATFERPVNAVDCALEAARSVRRLGLRIRAGVHMGECVVANNKVRRVSVHIGARVGAKARGDEVLISSTVRDVLGDSGLRFSDRGEHDLKGVSGRWHLYAIEPRVRDTEADLPPLLEAQIPKPAPQSKRRRALLAVGTALAVLVAVVGYVVVRGPGGLSSVPADSVAQIDAASGAVRSAVPVSRRPVGLASAPDGVWVANSIDRTVTRVGSSDATRTVPVGPGPIAVASGGGSIWVANGDGSSVSRIDPASGSEIGAPIQAGNGLSAIAYGADALWLANSVDGTVWRVDPATGRKTLEVKVGAALSGLAVTDDAVWVTSETAGTLISISPTSGVILRVVRVGNGPAAVAVGGGAAWVANSTDGTGARVDVRSGTVRVFKVGLGPRAVAIAGRQVFIANEDDGTVSMLDARTGGTVRTIALGNAPMGLTAHGDSIWVSVRGGIRSYRGGTLKYGTGAFTETIDPSFVQDPSFFPIIAAAYDGLTAFKRVGGPKGSELVPNLAEEIRPPTDNGTTYTFTLRAGLRYSDGTPVRASDVRATYERIMQREGELYGSAFLTVLKDSERCSPKGCDLSAGIVTDDRARTVVFHLRHALADFPYQLAVPSLVIVPGTAPRSGAGTTAVPGTGPYRVRDVAIDAAGRSGRFVLDRNPFFRPRGVAQPDGYADRIEVSMDGKIDHIEAVKSGREDFTTDTFGQDVPLAQLATEVPAQLHIYDAPFSLWIGLNTKVAPFNDVRVRRALNYALDRKALVGKTSTSQPLQEVACQLLPKNTIGYVPYCPYTRSPNASGIWTGPDVAMGRRLVALSGTAGQSVTVWISGKEDPGTEERSVRAPVIVAALRAIGYKAKVGVIPGNYFEEFTSPDGRYQVGLAGWISDYPAASNFVLPLATCPETLQRLAGGSVFNANMSHFCSRKVDALTEQALSAQQDDPAAVRDRWAAVDRAISDEAPFVAWGTLHNAVLGSRRAGNILGHPVYTVLLSQIWVVETPNPSPS
jgi:peptide/nickel transport system substrate-binding protein